MNSKNGVHDDEVSVADLDNRVVEAEFIILKAVRYRSEQFRLRTVNMTKSMVHS